MSRPAPRPLAIALDHLATKLAPATTLARVQQVWESVAGPTVAAAGTPVAERDGTLTIACSDAVWASELTMMSEQLLQRLTEALGEQSVERLRCHVR